MDEITPSNLDNEFEKWMKSEMGYLNTSFRQEVLGSDNEETYVMDIYGEWIPAIFKWLGYLGFGSLGLAGIAYMYPDDFYLLLSWLSGRGINISFILFIAVLVGFGLINLGLKHLGTKKTTRISWVHCGKTEMVSDQEVALLAKQVQDVKDDPEQDWSPNLTIIVSAENFEEIALETAREARIHCYQPGPNGFERVR